MRTSIRRWRCCPMNNGILIFGPNGAGKSTLVREVSEKLGFFAMDAEDYYFPHQAEARRKAMDGIASAEKGMPFAEARTAEDVRRAMLADMRKNPRFVLCGVKADWDGEIIARIGLAFFLNAPLDVRLERIAERDRRRFGERAAPGGDMYERQSDFRRMVVARGEMPQHTAAGKLKCSVITLDGRVPPAENTGIIAGYINTGAF